MWKKVSLGVASGLAVLLVAGGLFASNIAFKINIPILGPGVGSLSGTNTLAMPYYQQTDLVDAKDFIDDINISAGSSVVNVVGTYVTATDGLQTYSGLSGTAFPLVPGHAYFVQVNSTVDEYIIVGAHNPSLIINMLGPGDGGHRGHPVSLSGNDWYSLPCDSCTENAKDLIDEINAAAGFSVVNVVGQFVEATDGVQTYNGLSGTPFALECTKGYSIQITASMLWLPLHPPC